MSGELQALLKIVDGVKELGKALIEPEPEKEKPASTPSSTFDSATTRDYVQPTTQVPVALLDEIRRQVEAQPLLRGTPLYSLLARLGAYR